MLMLNKMEPAFITIKKTLLLMGRDALLFVVRTNAQSISRKLFQNRPNAINYQVLASSAFLS